MLDPAPTPTGSVSVRLLDDVSGKPAILADAIAGNLNGIAVIAAADLDGTSDDKKNCDEVAIARAGDSFVSLYRICDPANPTAMHTFTPLTAPTVALNDGGQIRSLNAAMALADLNGDGYADLIVNSTDCELRVAYGLGDGRFNSTPPPPGGVFQGTPDQKTGVFQAPAELKSLLVSQNAIFVVGKFNPSMDGNSGSQIIGLDCPAVKAFSSEVCQATAARCEAVVVDIDGDGVSDFVASQGQQPGLSVNRAIDGGGFRTVSIDTQCPPHALAAGDFDFDGVDDVAFLDQAPSIDGTPTATIRIIYGKKYDAPEAADTGSRFQHATGLSTGQLVDDANLGPQLVAVRAFQDAKGNGTGTGVALIEDSTERQLLAPFYFPDTNMQSMSALLSVDLIAQAGGKFSSDATLAGGLAVVTSDPASTTSLARKLWLVGIAGDTVQSDLSAVESAVTLPDCTQCVVTSANVDGEGLDELVLFGDGKDKPELVVYSGTAKGFVEKSRQTLTHTFYSYELMSNPAQLVPRPLVGRFDGDDHTDIILRSMDHKLIGFWGRGDGTFEETDLVNGADPDSAACAGQAIAALDLDGDGSPELVVVGPGILQVCTLDKHVLKKKSGLTLPLAAPDASTDYVAISAGDVDGDGIVDLAVMRSSSSINLLRGIPVRK